MAMRNGHHRRSHTRTRSRKVTLAEIARAAGVSVATASRVLSGGAKVSAELERKVLNAVQRLGGSSHPRARTGLFAVLLGNRPILHGFHTRVLLGIESFFRDRGAATMFLPLHYNPELAPNAVALPRVLQLRHSAVDGFVLAGTHSANLIERLERLDRPFVVYGNNMCGDWDTKHVDSVFSDDFGGAYEVTRHLIEAGRREIWFLADRDLPWRRTRYEGYRKAVEEAGLQPRALPVTPTNEAEAGYLAAKSLFAGGSPVDAILAGGDPAAQGVYEAARERELRVGIDLSVAGFDDFQEGVALDPPLTTVRTFPEEIGQRLAELVWRRSEDKSLPPRRMIVPTRLIHRESVRMEADASRRAKPVTVEESA